MYPPLIILNNLNMLIKKLGLSLIGLAFLVNISVRIAEHYQNRPRTVTVSEFYYDSLNTNKINPYGYLKYASYVLGVSGAGLALKGNVNSRINLHKK